MKELLEDLDLIDRAAAQAIGTRMDHVKIVQATERLKGFIQSMAAPKPSPDTTMPIAQKVAQASDELYVGRPIRSEKEA